MSDVRKHGLRLAGLLIQHDYLFRSLFRPSGLTNDPGVETARVDLVPYRLGIVGAGNDHHSQAHVENSRHLFRVNFPQALKPVEYRGNVPATSMDLQLNSGR